MSETIGVDIAEIIRSTEIPEGKIVIHANTPSYVGSHVTGFSNMVKAMVTYLAEPSEEKTQTINIIPGYVEPSDMKEIKRILKLMNVPFIMFPDTSDVVNSPITGKYSMSPKGGAKVEDIKKSGSSKATIAMGSFSSKDVHTNWKQNAKTCPHH